VSIESPAAPAAVAADARLLADMETPHTTSKARELLAQLAPPHLIAVVLVLGAVVSRLGPLTDPDIWWHLRTGQYILDHHALPGHDRWSLVAHGHAWLGHEWLSQVLLASTYDVFGLRGITAYRAVGVLVLLALLAVQAFRRTTPYRALGITALAVFGTYAGWGERPQLLSFILLVPAGLLARRAAEGRLPWQLVPLTWLWANLHGMWFLGPVVVGAAALGLLLDRRTEVVSPVARTIALCAASVAAAALTPNGPRLILEPIRVGRYAKYVSEWDPPSIHMPYGLAFFALLGLLLFTMSRRRQVLPWSTLLPVFLAAYLGLSYIRTIAPAVVILVPYIAKAVGRSPDSKRERERGPVALNGVLCGLLAIVAAAGSVLVMRTTPILPTHAPVAATAALERLPGPQRVVNEYDVGGWLLWHAPTAQPAVDGRTEIYSTSYLDRYFSALRLSDPDWAKTIRALHPTAALLHVDTPLVTGLRDILHWRVVYRDDTWLVLTPPGGGQQP
jgi:hypothetical protein